MDSNMINTGYTAGTKYENIPNTSAGVSEKTDGCFADMMSEKYHISERQIRRDANSAIEEIAVLMFGIDGIRKMWFWDSKTCPKLVLDMSLSIIYNNNIKKYV